MKFILLAGLFLISVLVNAQVTKFTDITFGVTSTEAVSIGVRRIINQNTLAFNIGTADFRPGDSRREAFGTSVTYARHLWGSSAHTPQHPWFVKTGVGYIYTRNEIWDGFSDFQRLMAARVYFGRDINFSSRVGLSVSLGPMLIYRLAPDKQPYRSAGLDFLFFYRLKKKQRAVEVK